MRAAHWDALWIYVDVLRVDRTAHLIAQLNMEEFLCLSKYIAFFADQTAIFASWLDLQQVTHLFNVSLVLASIPKHYTALYTIALLIPEDKGAFFKDIPFIQPQRYWGFTFAKKIVLPIEMHILRPVPSHENPIFASVPCYQNFLIYWPKLL
jgi:hypothetical protein